MNKTHLSKNIINLKICFFVGQTSKQKLTEKFWLYKCISLFAAYIWYFLSRLWHLENYIVTKGAIMAVIIGSWIYNYLCNQCLSPLRFWIPLRQGVPDTTLCDKVCQWLATGQWLSPGTPVSSTNIKTDLHHKNEILLKVALLLFKGFGFGFMVFNATFNNISVISWRSVSLVEETRVPGENHWPVASHWQTLSHNVVLRSHRYEWGSNSQL
jgi:hypothetical protein